ncbi:MAG: uroporphyrinogen decarboxylase family protein [Thermacetogeniaceae bacterium]
MQLPGTTPAMESIRFFRILLRPGADLLVFSELVDLAVAQKVFVGRIAVGGTVDPSQVLFLGTPQEVDEHVREIIERLPFKTGAILAPGCGLSPNYPVENLKAFLDAARRHGTYH